MAWQPFLKYKINFRQELSGEATIGPIVGARIVIDRNDLPPQHAAARIDLLDRQDCSRKMLAFGDRRDAGLGK